ncbi:MAG: hypothetical protein EBR09_16175 [Proteobacteria bacterium]|nr:hypothetical protein [Pseudomonadota bacterium]
MGRAPASVRRSRRILRQKYKRMTLDTALDACRQGPAARDDGAADEHPESAATTMRVMTPHEQRAVGCRCERVDHNPLTLLALVRCSCPLHSHYAAEYFDEHNDLHSHKYD